LSFIAKESFDVNSCIVLTKIGCMNFKKLFTAEIIVGALAFLYATILILKNPQPFGKIALIATFVFVSASLLKHVLLK